MATSTEIVELVKSTANNKDKSEERKIKQSKKSKRPNRLFGLEDENIERGNWSGRLDFFLSCLGYAVGFGNLWRFPFLAYKHGGGAFLIPYLLFLVLVGMPIFMLEVSLGQFTSNGPFTCWGYAPLFKGLGIGSVMVATYYSINYNVLLAWSFWYLFASFTSELPWANCGTWSTEFCSDRVRGCNSSDASEIRFHGNGTCYLQENSTLTFAGIFNATAAAENGIKVKIPAQEYLEYVSLRDKLADFEHLGPLRWDMALCLLLAWAVVFLCLIKGIKSSGKVVYFTALFPYLVLIILFINMLTLKGAGTGVAHFITPNVSKLTSPEPWKDAAVQIFFTLSAAESGLITLASYNRFSNNVVRDTLLIPFCNCLTSFFAGFIVFGYIGYLADYTNSPIDALADSGSALAFVVYPQALTSLPAPFVWSIIFFLMLITLGLDSQFALVEAIVTAVCDQWAKQLRQKKWLVILVFCCIAYLLGLTMATDGGTYVLTFIDTYAGGFNVMLIAILECLSISYAYGGRRFASDIQAMSGDRLFGCIPWRLFRWWWIFCWAFVTPVFVGCIFVFSFVDYPTLKHAGYNYPIWAEVLGWLMTSSVVLAILLTALIRWLLLMRKGDAGGACQSLAILCQPETEWGPALDKNREKVMAVTQGHKLDKHQTSEECDVLLLQWSLDLS